MDPVVQLQYHFRLVVRGRGLLRSKVGGAGLAACVCVLWLAPTTGAQSVYDQYTEQIPAANGPHNTNSGGPGAPGGSGGSGGTSGGGAGGGAAIVLPATLNQDGGKDAKTLREVATSPRFGAPNSTFELPADSTRNSQASVSAALNAVTDGSDGRMVGLFVALLAITAVSLGFAAARRRTL